MPSGEPTGEAQRYATLRVAAAVVVAAALLAYVVLSQRPGDFQSCSARRESSNGSQVTNCQPVGATSAPTLIGALLIALLLLPDFAEIAVPGLLSLKRRVQDQERRQDALEQRLEANLSQTTSVTTQVPIAIDAGVLRRASLRVDEVEGVLRDSSGDGESAEGTADEETERPSDEQSSIKDDETNRALLTSELISRWERLAEGASLAQEVQPVSDMVSNRSVRSQATLIAWYRQFPTERDYVRAARNAVAHGRPIDFTTLQLAVELARKLEDAMPPIDAASQAEAMEGRAVDWLSSRGMERWSRPLRHQFDFAGRDGDALVVAEMKWTSRPLMTGLLRRWLHEFETAADDAGAKKMILVIAAPEVSQKALTWFREDYSPEVATELFREVRPGEFTLLAARDKEL